LTKTTRLFYFAIIIMVLAQFSKFFAPEAFQKHQHLSSSSFVQWSFLSSIPSMYNYSNSVWVSPDPYDKYTFDEVVSGELDYVRVQLNHYPVRILSFRQDRDKVFGASIKTVYLRTSFFGSTRISAYEVNVVNGVGEVTLKDEYIGKN
jgi:hypothetical protein